MSMRSANFVKTRGCYGRVFAWVQTYLTELLCLAIKRADTLINWPGFESLRLHPEHTYNLSMNSFECVLIFN